MAFGLLPNDPKILSLSPTQELWVYTHVKRKEKRTEDLLMAKLKILCAFIDPERAKKVFSPEKEKIESTDFFSDMKKLDPNFDASQYEHIIEALKTK